MGRYIVFYVDLSGDEPRWGTEYVIASNAAAARDWLIRCKPHYDDIEAMSIEEVCRWAVDATTITDEIIRRDMENLESKATTP